MEIKNQSAKLIKAFSYLKGQISSEGWWPYIEGKNSSTESTAWCTIALQKDPAIADKATKYFLQTQNKDGGWSSAPNCGPSDWTSSLALLALVSANRNNLTGDTKKSIRKACDFLLDTRFEILQSFSRLLFILAQGPEYDYARGWPWTPDTFNWVEPTCFAMYALNETNKIIDDTKTKHRIERCLKHAQEYLFEFSCKNGGWNFGNNVVFGYIVPPMLINTCQALVALPKGQNQSAFKSAINYLEQEEKNESSVLSAAWTVIARHSLNLDFQPRLKILTKQQLDNGSFLNNCMITAIASIALNCQNNQNLLITN